MLTLSFKTSNRTYAKSLLFQNFLTSRCFSNTDQPTSLRDLHCLLSYVYSKGPLLWSSGQSSWLQIQRSGFDSQRYQIFWEVVSKERGPLSLVSTIEELLGRNRSGSSLENQEYGPRNLLRWPGGTLYQQKLALTSPKSGGRSVGIDARGLRPRSLVSVYIYGKDLC
jgi:hypothetical protein